jgi:hypothetical protein
VIDLRDFETKQIVVNPIFKSEHGGAFVTPNTEYVIEAAQYPAPLENRKFYPLEEFNEKYRGGVTYWKFDRKEGRIDPKESFSFELPPYWQDLSDAGKGPSDGWSFTNSFCSERYVGGIEKGRPPYEAGCSAKDTDYLHVINWKKAAEVVKAGKAKKINGHNVIPMEVAVQGRPALPDPRAEEPARRRRHPDGKFIIVAGKLDTHVSVYSFEKIQAAIKAGKFESKDPYGIPVIGLKDALHVQVPLGLGPAAHPVRLQGLRRLHLAVCRLAGRQVELLRRQGARQDQRALQHRPPDDHGGRLGRSKPAGKYLVALNKLAIDRFVPVGPLHPQNHQLIDISERQDAAALRHAVAAGRAALCRRDRRHQAQAGRALQGRHRQPHRQAASGRRPGRRGEDRQEGQQGHGLRHPDPLAHHARDHRGGSRRRDHHPPDQPRARPGRDPRLHGVDLQHARLGRAGQDRDRSSSRPTRKASIPTTARSSARRCTSR